MTNAPDYDKRRANLSLINKILFGGIGLMLVAFAGIVALMPTASERSASARTSSPAAHSAPTAPPEPPKVVYLQLDARTLMDAYAGNEVRADRDYKGEKVAVTGRVVEVAKDILNTPYVTLSDDGELHIPEVQAMFPTSAENDLAMLSPHQRVTVNCTVAGKMMNVLLRGCAVAK